MMRPRTKSTFKKAGSFLPARKRTCRFCSDKLRVIDYKDAKMLESFIKERGTVVSTRVTGNCAKHQRRIVEAVKRARYLSLLPYVKV